MRPESSVTTTYGTLQDALDDGWVVARHVDVALDKSEGSSVGYQYELGYSGVMSTTISLTQARNAGGGLGAFLAMFRAEDVKRASAPQEEEH